MISKEELINKNINLVKNLAARYYTNKIGIEYEDLVSYGVIALIDASYKFNDEKGARFSTYAYIKINSYIIDIIRKQSFIPRVYLSKLKEYNSCIEYLQQKNFRQPTIYEISDYMGISTAEVDKIKRSISNLNISSIDNIDSDAENDFKFIDRLKDEAINIEDYIEKEELILTLKKAINMLSEREQLVISLYYYEKRTLKEIGEVLGVSTTRASKLNKKAISNLRSIMKKLNYLH
ncbi:RNA polymerase sigma-28factor for flagellar operon [[Clostridium] sordellii]|uniref:sigma-70 family RNA polymerase sigma factor n=1 Tax=Paraclostridium sordellii TaxID=1505 RepID=UPI000543C39D|nr:sigma-70 family RNA polymerase sigma factor [Paeniclostridium sordellii]CEK29382.1 RNA polymerase sigma-28factor for flagellar operon [[Clostridium] sordellii] [Paeniclostridium sordellii]